MLHDIYIYIHTHVAVTDLGSMFLQFERNITFQLDATHFCISSVCTHKCIYFCQTSSNAAVPNLFIATGKFNIRCFNGFTFMVWRINVTK